MAPKILVRRLGPGDEAVLTRLAVEDADFDLDGRGGDRAALDAGAARRYLADPAVLFWIATNDDVVGFLSCVVVPLRSGDGRELLLYEIGVRQSRRRSGIGRALLNHMEEWMRTNHVPEVWVCADNPIAVGFYRGCGFKAPVDQPVYMTHRPANVNKE